MFGLTPPFKLSDVKKAYHRLVHENHPDHFQHTGTTRQQSLIMAEISSVYQSLLAQFSKDSNAGAPKTPGPKETPYTLYKEALDYYKEYFDTFFKMFSERTLYNPEEKEQCLQTARNLFSRLLSRYPDSEWSSDAEDKIEKIDRAIESLYK